LFSIFLLPYAFSYYITPGKAIIYFEPGEETTVSVRVVNDDGPTKNFELIPSARNKEISGNINNIVHIEEPKLLIEEGKSHTFLIDIKLPENLSYGTHELFVNVFGDNPGKGEMVSARKVLGFKIIIHSLYPGKYVDVVLLEPKSVNIGEVVVLKTSIGNLGTDDIDDVRAKVDIYNEEEYIESAYSLGSSLKSKERKEFVAHLATDSYEVGEYTARASAEYDGMTKNATLIHKFDVGDLRIDIINISSSKFENDKINKFDILVESVWNRPAETYAEIIVNDIDGNKKAEFKTQAVVVSGWGRTDIPAYFDVNNIENGNYTLNITLHYEKKTSGKVFPVEISEKGEAEIVDKMPFSPSTESLLIVGQGVIILVLIAVLLMVFLRRKRKKGISKEGK